jgi:hypothetical protein
MLNCYCQLSSSVIFRQYGVSQSECKIDPPRPGLPRVSPRPHTEALGTRLGTTLIEIGCINSREVGNSPIQISGFSSRWTTNTWIQHRRKSRVWHNVKSILRKSVQFLLKIELNKWLEHCWIGVYANKWKVSHNHGMNLWSIQIWICSWNV